MRIRSKRTALVIGGLVIAVCLVVEVINFGVPAFYAALGVWLMLVGPALAVTPRRGPEDELWLFGVFRELLNRPARESESGGEAGAKPPVDPDGHTGGPVASATVPPGDPEEQIWLSGIGRELIHRLDRQGSGGGAPAASGTSADSSGVPSEPALPGETGHEEEAPARRRMWSPRGWLNRARR